MSEKPNQITKGERLQLGIEAQALLKSDNYKIIEKYLEGNAKVITQIIESGLAPSYDDHGNMVQTANDKYWEFVGKSKMLKDLPRFLNQAVRDMKAIEKKNNEQ